MAAIEPVLFVTAAGFAVVVVATILVIIGVHQEERRGTLARRPPPTIPALLARRVLGSYIQLLPLDHAAKSGPGQPSTHASISSAPEGNQATPGPGR
jgi:hypothetical protein